MIACKPDRTLFADTIRASSLNRLHQQAGQTTAPDGMSDHHFMLATREPSADVIPVWPLERRHTTGTDDGGLRLLPWNGYNCPAAIREKQLRTCLAKTGALLLGYLAPLTRGSNASTCAS